MVWAGLTAKRTTDALCNLSPFREERTSPFLQRRGERMRASVIRYQNIGNVGCLIIVFLPRMSEDTVHRSVKVGIVGKKLCRLVGSGEEPDHGLKDLRLGQ